MGPDPQYFEICCIKYTVRSVENGTLWEVYSHGHIPQYFRKTHWTKEKSAKAYNQMSSLFLDAIY